MNFGDILDQWERREPPAAGGFIQKDKELETITESPAERRRRLIRKGPDGTLDLHGMTQDDAWQALSRFFDDAREQGFEKLLVIHGKGNHAGQENQGPEAPPEIPDPKGILKNVVRNFIERCPFAGESGHSAASAGGAGSTWVLLKTPSVPDK